MKMRIPFAKIGKVIGEIAPILIGLFFFVVPAVLLFYLFTHPASTAADWAAKDYAKSVLESQHPGAEPASAGLFDVNPDQPITVVTWMPHRFLASYQASQPQDRDIWVTVVPFLKTACRQYPADPAKLQLRLNQRLGMPPNAANDTFVELSIDPSKVNLFRPCGGDPTIADNKCSAALPKPVDVWGIPDEKGFASAGEKDTEWVLRNYYSNYSAASPYPWTALGYTFDWARDEQGKFVRKGESEFILPAKSQYQFVSATDTATYCRP